MRSSHRVCILLLLCLALIPVSISAASFSVDQVSFAGPDAACPGDSVQVSVRISFDAAGEVTFPGGDMLQLSTALVQPVWNYTLFVDNHPVQTFSRESGVVFINGYYLEYAQGRSEYLSVEVTGTIPDGVDGDMIDALTVTQYDGYGTVRGDGITTVPVAVHANNESVQPETPHVPNRETPVPTQSPLHGFTCMAGIVCAMAASIRKKKINRSVQ